MKPHGRSVIVGMSLGVGMALLPAQAEAFFTQTNLVSDQPGEARFTDPNLINAWGMASSPTGPIWVSATETGVSTVYNGQGQGFPVGNPLVVTIPGGGPTGQVYNGTASFDGTSFIFATEAGNIAAWKGTFGTTAQLEFSSPVGAIYKGLAIIKGGVTDRIYATDFHNNKIDVFDSSFSPVSLPGAFQDPNIPSGYAPFGIQNIGGHLFVSYAKQDANAEDDVAGPGNGFIDEFDADGNLVQRLVSNGPLNAPWGFALAPGGFGAFGGDLLVSNFGDGTINAFDPVTGAFRGALTDASGNPIVIDGLWGLLFGNGGNGGAPNQLFFTAGPDDESHGLVGFLAVPEPSTMALLASGAVLLALRRRRRT